MDSVDLFWGFWLEKAREIREEEEGGSDLSCRIQPPWICENSDFEYQSSTSFLIFCFQAYDSNVEHVIIMVSHQSHYCNICLCSAKQLDEYWSPVVYHSGFDSRSHPSRITLPCQRMARVSGPEETQLLFLYWEEHLNNRVSRAGVGSKAIACCLA